LFNNPWFSSSASDYLSQSDKFLNNAITPIGTRQSWSLFAAAAFLVSVPVFIQAPLVRQFPLLSLVMTLVWVGIGWKLLKHPKTHLWGDLLLGFSWSWLAGSIYWGWLRWEPLIHLPVEAMGLPFVIWSLRRGWGKIGNLFYLGSLFGTVVTDVYFYLTDLIPYWRQVMQVDPALATPILQNAIAQVQTPWGITLAAIFVATLLLVGMGSLAKRQLAWWAFSGAVLSTIFVDGLFWVAASMV
jgi:hypothetical protein